MLLSQVSFYYSQSFTFTRKQIDLFDNSAFEVSQTYKQEILHKVKHFTQIH